MSDEPNARYGWGKAGYVWLFHEGDYLVGAYYSETDAIASSNEGGPPADNTRIERFPIWTELQPEEKP